MGRAPSRVPLVGIVGPTASGKTDLALALARRVEAEILVADSRQVYRGMDIGTAKPDAAARRRFAPDAVAVRGMEMVVAHAETSRNSRTATALKKIGVDGTARNWRTLTALVELTRS